MGRTPRQLVQRLAMVFGSKGVIWNVDTPQHMTEKRRGIGIVFISYVHHLNEGSMKVVPRSSLSTDQTKKT